MKLGLPDEARRVEPKPGSSWGYSSRVPVDLGQPLWTGQLAFEVVDRLFKHREGCLWAQH